MSKPISYRMKCGCNYTFYASDAVVLYSRECVNECDQHSVSKTEKRMQAKIDQLQAENERLRAALEEYADDHSWGDCEQGWDIWNGRLQGWEIARAALAESEPKP